MEKRSYSLRRPGDTYLSFREKDGALEVIQNTVQYERESKNGGVEGAATENVLLTLNRDVYDSLKNWLNVPRKENKQIDYRDKTYSEKRRILRQLSIKDEIRNFLDIITDEVHTCIMYDFRNRPYKSIKEQIGIDIDDLTFWHYIRTLLIDGFLSFEIIYDSKQKNILDLNPVDPLSMIAEMDQQTRKMYWIQYPDIPTKKRILTDDQIIYMSYSNNISESHTSYVEELKESYERLKMVESAVFFPQTLQNGTHVDLMSAKWLSECLNNISRIPKSQVSLEWSDPKNDNFVRYNNFIKRIVRIFQCQLFDKINKIKQ